jgi:hypothetical protein
VSLYAVLNEEVMALHSITHIVLDSKIVNSMDGDNSGIGLMNCITPCERSRDVSCHMEMYAISA